MSVEVNTSIELGLEQGLKALIPYLRGLSDPAGVWNFLDVFPEDFLYMAGHEATDLPDEATAFLAFIAGLPDFRAIGFRYPMIPVKFELATAGIGDVQTRTQAVINHSRRAAAILRLFSPRYYESLREIFNIAPNPDDRPWKGLGFDAWNAEPPAEGRSPTGNAFIASPSYIFVVHFELEPAI